MKFACLLAIIVSYQGQLAAQVFSKQEMSGRLVDAGLKELSGIAPSSIKKNCFWVHNDSGDSARIFMIDRKGQLKGTVYFNEKVKDCEDIASGIGMQKGNYIYLADIGDNIDWRGKTCLYIFKEKNLLQALPNGKIGQYKKTMLEYEDGMFNAEAIMVDPIDSLLYVVTKDKEQAAVYFAKIRDVFIRDRVTLTKIAITNHTTITAADISRDGKEVLLKNYDSIFYWKRKGREPIYETLQRRASVVPYEKEDQGEAICFALDNGGFYTVSEGKFSPIYYFKKKK